MEMWQVGLGSSVFPSHSVITQPLSTIHIVKMSLATRGATPATVRRRTEFIIIIIIKIKNSFNLSFFIFLF